MCWSEILLIETQMVRTFYRVVKSMPPTERDFMSNAAKGLPPRGPELSHPELHTGISVFSDIEIIRGIMRQTRLRGLIAKLVVPERAPVRMEKTLGRGHYTVWAAPSLLLRFVERVVE